MTDTDPFEVLFDFVSYAAQLRQVTRNNLGTPDRLESVAEHSWHLSLMCLALFDMIQQAEPERLDLLRMLKMAIVHDLVEIDCGDPSAWNVTADRSGKARCEAEAAERRIASLPDPVGTDLMAVWTEMGIGTTREAQIFHAIDRVNPALMRVLTGQGWSDVGAAVEDLDRLQLPRVSASPVTLRLYHQVRARAVAAGLFSARAREGAEEPGLAVNRIAAVSRLDRWFVGAPPIDVIYSFSYPLDLNRLMLGLDQALEALPEFACHLLQDGEGGYRLGRLDGSLPVEVVSSDLADARLSPLELLQARVHGVTSVPGEPLCRIRLTRTAEGSTLGISVSHLVADAFTLRCFVARLEAALQQCPVPQGFRLQSVRLQDAGDEAPRYTARGAPVGGAPGPPTPRLTRLSRFAAEARRPRAGLAAFAERLDDDGGRVSEGDLMTAYAAKAWGAQMFDAASNVRLRLAVDARQCLPQPDPGLVGNALVDVVIGGAHEDWRHLSLVETARLVRNRVNDLRREMIEGGRRHVYGRPLADQDWFTSLWDHSFTPFDPATDLAIANVMRLGLDIDMGAGRATRRVTAASASNAIILSLVDGDVAADILSVRPVSIEIDELWRAHFGG